MDNYKEPKLVNGLIPDKILEMQFQEAKEEAIRKKQFRHDWLLACFSAIIGAIFGFISSLIFWLVSK